MFTLNASNSAFFDDMPVLQHLQGVFRKEFEEDFSKLSNKDNTVFIIIQHGFETILPMMNAILNLGIRPEQVFMTTKPHTTSQEMLSYFQETFGTNYVPFQWEITEQETLSLSAQAAKEQTHYKNLTSITHDKLFEKFCDYLLRHPSPMHIKNIIICDEGGKFLSKFIKYYRNPDQRYTKKLSDYHVVAIEHTRRGTYSEALGHLPFPLINMAESYLKTHIESRFIAKSMLVNLQSVLQAILTSSSNTIGVVGAGSIGREVINFLRKKYPNSTILIYDQEPSVLSSQKIKEKGWKNVIRIGEVQKLFQKANVILGCTGKDITRYISQECITNNQASHIHLISCSSGDVEFSTLLQSMKNYKPKSLTDIHDWTITLSTSDEKKITIYNGGFPINFLINQPESVPLHEVQATRGMKFAAIVQAIKLLEIVRDAAVNQDTTLPLLIKLDEHYQYEIFHSFSDHALNAKYKELFVKVDLESIKQKSCGSDQPAYYKDTLVFYPDFLSERKEIEHNILKLSLEILISIASIWMSLSFLDEGEKILFSSGCDKEQYLLNQIRKTYLFNFISITALIISSGGTLWAPLYLEQEFVDRRLRQDFVSEQKLSRITERAIIIVLSIFSLIISGDYFSMEFRTQELGIFIFAIIVHFLTYSFFFDFIFKALILSKKSSSDVVKSFFCIIDCAIDNVLNMPPEKLLETFNKIKKSNNLPFRGLLKIILPSNAVIMSNKNAYVLDTSTKKFFLFFSFLTLMPQLLTTLLKIFGNRDIIMKCNPKYNTCLVADLFLELLGEFLELTLRFVIFFRLYSILTNKKPHHEQALKMHYIPLAATIFLMLSFPLFLPESGVFLLNSIFCTLAIPFGEKLLAYSFYTSDFIKFLALVYVAFYEIKERIITHHLLFLGSKEVKAAEVIINFLEKSKDILSTASSELYDYSQSPAGKHFLSEFKVTDIVEPRNRFFPYNGQTFWTAGESINRDNNQTQHATDRTPLVDFEMSRYNGNL